MQWLVGDNGGMANEITLAEIIDTLWIHPENAEWTPKVERIAGVDFRQWMGSKDIEVLGFVYHLLGDKRFRMEPELSLDEYLEFVRKYYERCIVENPDGEWSDSRWAAGHDLAGVFTFHWNKTEVPRSVMDDWKHWLGDIYKRAPDEVRTCIVQSALEHLLEQEAFRKFFFDWTRESVLKKAYEEALEWYKGGGRMPLGTFPAAKPLVRSKRKKH
jgi:hypothetical protein